MPPTSKPPRLNDASPIMDIPHLEISRAREEDIKKALDQLPEEAKSSLELVLESVVLHMERAAGNVDRTANPQIAIVEATRTVTGYIGRLANLAKE